MSSGAFVAGFYAMDDGTIINARYQPESSITAVNPPVSGPADFGFSANLQGSMRKNGVNARRFFGRWTTPPANYLVGGRVTLPVFTKADWDAINKGDIVDYLTGTFRVTGKAAEVLV